MNQESEFVEEAGIVWGYGRRSLSAGTLDVVAVKGEAEVVEHGVRVRVARVYEPWVGWESWAS